MNISKLMMTLFSVDTMVRKKDRMGELPSNKEAYQLFLKLAWPSILESLLISMIGFIDTAMVGVLGKNAIAAVGITNQPKYVLLAVIFSMNTGVTAVSARRKGEENQEGANRVMRVSLLAAILLGCLIVTVGVLFAKPIIQIAGAQPEYLDDAVTYFQIIVVGLFFSGINLVINAAQRGCGNTKISMRTNVVANVINLILDYLLIEGRFGFPRLEVRGAAIATTVGCVVACGISIVTLMKKNGYLTLRKNYSWKIKKEVVQPIVRVSSSAFVEQVFLRIGFFVYAAMVARIGTVEYATHQICMTILNISFSFGDGIAIAASSLVGQMLGKKRWDLAMLYGKTGQRIAFVASTLLCLSFVGGATPLMELFSNDPQIIELGRHILYIIAITTYLQTSQIVYYGCLRGAGDSSYVAIISLISVTIIRPVLTYVLCFGLGFGLYGAWCSLLFDQMFRLTFATYRFYGGKWRYIQL